jgi:multidrug efflux pump subunit AcrB
MLAGTLVTIAGFVPIGFAASSAGEYTFSLFAVVGIALIVSWFVAVIFSPLLGVWILAAPKSATPPAPGRLMKAYRRFLSGAISARWLTIAVTLAFFVGSILVMPLIPRQFFPASDRPELLVDLQLPQNASIYASDAMTRRFDAALKDDPDVERWRPMSGAGPSASICRSMPDCRTTSSASR